MLDTELEAGRELDTLIANRVTGWQPTEHDADHVTADGYWCDWCSYHGDSAWHLAIVPSYSTDIAAAWQVVECMARDYTPRVNGLPGGTVFLFWWERANLWADSAPEAAARICRAALAIHAGQIPPG